MEELSVLGKTRVTGTQTYIPRHHLVGLLVGIREVANEASDRCVLQSLQVWPQAQQKRLLLQCAYVRMYKSFEVQVNVYDRVCKHECHYVSQYH